MTQLTVNTISLSFECEVKGCSLLKSLDRSWHLTPRGACKPNFQEGIVILVPLVIVNTYSVFLNSSSVSTVYDINEGKGLRQILCDYLVHDVGLTNTWTINYNHAFLKYNE